MGGDLKLLQSSVILYPMWVEDLEIRRKEAITFDTISKCASFLGITGSQVSQKIAKKQYCYHKETKLKYAPRFYTKKDTVQG